MAEEGEGGGEEGGGEEEKNLHYGRRRRCRYCANVHLTDADDGWTDGLYFVTIRILGGISRFRNSADEYSAVAAAAAPSFFRRLYSIYFPLEGRSKGTHSSSRPSPARP